MTGRREHALYYVGLKILLKKRGGRVLMLKSHSNTGGKFWDLPGGRINKAEHKTPLAKIIAREVSKEISLKVNFKLGPPLFQFRRYLKKSKMYVFLTVYGADYLSGEVEISDEHTGYEWIDPKTYRFSKAQFFNAEEYLAFIGYFKNI